MSWHLGPLPLAERVRWVADSPLGALSLLAGNFTAEDRDRVDDEVVRLLGNSDLGVTVHPAAVAFDGSDREKAFRRAIEGVAELQRATGRVECVAVDPAICHQGGVVHYDPEGTLRSLEFILRTVGDLGVRAGVENWKINPDPEEFRRLAAELGDIGLLLDLGHLHVMTEDPVAAASDLPLPVCEVHVHDNKGKVDSHMPLGRGNLPLEGLARALRAGGFRGVWTLEIRPTYRTQESTISNPKATKTIVESAALLADVLSRVDAEDVQGSQSFSQNLEPPRLGGG